MVNQKEGRELMIDWSKKLMENFTGMIIPNVF
jgi:hypothetical protein